MSAKKMVSALLSLACLVGTVASFDIKAAKPANQTVKVSIL
jgi:hypothetical protein